MGILFESVAVEVFISLVFFVYILYRYLMSAYDFWASQGVPYIKPIPLFGTSLTSLLSLKPVNQTQKERYDFFGKNRFGGLYTFRKPSLFLKDPELIEQILIKDFAIFNNRGIKINTKLDPLSSHLVNLRDSKWKNLRSKLTPTFSSGKLKGMQDQFLESSEKLVDHLKKFEFTEEPFELKTEMSKFTMNVVASCAFGLSLNIFENPNSEFKKMGERFFAGTFLTRIRITLRSSFPSILTLFRWKSLPKRTEDFFMSVVKDTKEYRENNNIRRNDFLQLLMDLRKHDLQNPDKANDLIFDDTLMAANAFVFFVAGFETTASTLSCLLYELSRNQDIQTKLYKEIKHVLRNHNGEISYDIIKEITYLEQVISETLRKYPPAPAIAREARMPYQIPGTSIVLPKDTMVTIPIYSLHHDPKYFPDPEKFDPDRFAKDKEIIKGTYLPFGEGPRICIGLRFAKLEIKYAIIKLLQNFEFTVNEKTQEPLQYSRLTILLNIKGGLWINVHKRKECKI